LIVGEIIPILALEEHLFPKEEVFSRLSSTHLTIFSESNIVYFERPVSRWRAILGKVALEDSLQCSVILS
jgi:hypothetical protein